jgi:hypothetical protein
VEFEVRGDEGSGEFSVSGCAGAGAEDRRGDVMELFAVLMKEWEFSFSLGGGRRMELGDGTNCVLVVWMMHTLSATMGPLVALVSAAIYGVYNQ